MHKAFNNPLWLSANVLLAHGRMGDGFFENPYRIELKEQRVTPLPRLFTPATIWDNKGPWTLSSDHRWILWRHGHLEPTYQFVATRIDGRVSVRWTVDRAHCDGPFFWQPGTHRWVHLLVRREEGTTLREAQFFDLDHPDRKRVVPLPPLKQTYLLGVRPDGSVLLTDRAEWCHVTGRRVHLTELRFIQGRAVVRTRAIPSPASGEIAQVCLSPDGKRLAWLIEQGMTRDKDGSPTPQWARLYVSGVDGKNPRALGRVRFKTDNDEYDTLLHGWYPDNRRLLLQVRNRLCCVSASSSRSR
jgi:hypothetical protein